MTDKVADEEVSDNKILPYCSIDKKADKRSLGEMEQDFLEALQVISSLLCTFSCRNI